MALLIASDLHKDMAGQPLLKGVSFKLERRERLTIAGRNGAGLLDGNTYGWADLPVHLVVGMKQAKDSAEFLRPLLPAAETVWAVQEPAQHAALPIEAIIAASGGVARPGPLVTDALRAIAGTGRTGRVLICGSLYLAGEVLKLDQDKSN